MSAVAGSVRPGVVARPNPLAVLAAFIRRDWTLAWSYRVPFLMGLGQSVTTVGFLYFLGRLVGPRIASAGQGLSGGYFAYAIVGTTLLAFFSVTLTSFAQRLRQDQMTGTLEVLLTMPPRPAATMLYSGSYQLIYSVLVNIVTLALAATVGLRFTPSVAGALLAVATLLASLAFFWAVGVAFAAFVVVFKRGETLTAIGTSVLMLVGGVYYPVALMPHVLRDLAEVIPFTWALEVLRGTLLTGSLPLLRFGELCAVTAIVVPVSLSLFSAAVDRARRLGTLGQY